VAGGAGGAAVGMAVLVAEGTGVFAPAGAAEGVASSELTRDPRAVAVALIELKSACTATPAETVVVGVDAGTSAPGNALVPAEGRGLAGAELAAAVCGGRPAIGVTCCTSTGGPAGNEGPACVAEAAAAAAAVAAALTAVGVATAVGVLAESVELTMPRLAAEAALDAPLAGVGRALVSPRTPAA